MLDIIKYDKVDLERKDMPVLTDVSFTVRPGEFIYIIGKVGTGKSTLLKSIFADTPIKRGSANVLGYDLCDIHHKQIPYLRRKIGFIFQDFRLLDDRDVFSNLDFVLAATGTDDTRTRHDRVDQVLLMVGMSEKSYKLPHELSGGEQQRVAVARALLNKPQLILADEPTGNLDNENANLVMSHLYNAARGGASVLVATHNLSLPEFFPGRIFVCDNNKIIIK